MQHSPPGNTDHKSGVNTLQKQDLPIHAWYRFVLSFPPHLVRQYIAAFQLGPDDLLLDPFCGTGTTLVEARKNGIPSIGCDAHPLAALVSRVKTNWEIDLASARAKLRKILKRAEDTGSRHHLPPFSLDPLPTRAEAEPGFPVNGFQLTEEEEQLLPTGFLSQRPLQRLLILRAEIERQVETPFEQLHEFFLVALAHVIANGAGNFAFGPEIYRTRPKADYDVLGHFARQANLMIDELREMQKAALTKTKCRVVAGDSRELGNIPGEVAAVITSPPYPNEKDYTRTTRVESILLRLMTDKPSLRGVKETLLRSNTRNIFAGDQDAEEVKEFPSIQRICQEIENRRVALKKESGFERLYHKVVAHYFGGMRRHFRALRPKLRRDARLAYVVGDQLSFLMVPVATAALLSEVAQAEGYKAIGCDLWRERIGTKVRNSPTHDKTVRVREEILLLQKQPD